MREEAPTHPANAHADRQAADPPYPGAGHQAGVPPVINLSISVVVALLFATVVQMVLGELAPKPSVNRKHWGVRRRVPHAVRMRVDGDRRGQP
jgi:hypothetical protein